MYKYCRKNVMAVIFIIGVLLVSRGRLAAEGGGSIWGADYFPDVPLITHEGKKVRFFTDVIKGKVVALNFIYTNCPDACALETARLREVQRILGDRVGRDVFLYSITIDPANDGPKEVGQYAQLFNSPIIGLTGSQAQIDKMKKQKMTVEDAAVELTKPCVCGVFNPTRAAELLRRLL